VRQNWAAHAAPGTSAATAASAGDTSKADTTQGTDNQIEIFSNKKFEPVRSFLT
jgi:hypothetical protein